MITFLHLVTQLQSVVRNLSEALQNWTRVLEQHGQNVAFYVGEQPPKPHDNEQADPRIQAKRENLRAKDKASRDSRWFAGRIHLSTHLHRREMCKIAKSRNNDPIPQRSPSYDIQSL